MKKKLNFTKSRKTEAILYLVAAAICIAIPFLGTGQYVLRTLTLIGI